MKTIIWLASYPKSGNTWLRIFLTNLLTNSQRPADINNLERSPIASARALFDEAVGVASADLSHSEVELLRPEVYRHIARRANSPCFMKIHDANTCLDGDPTMPLIPPEATYGVLYILRNPLDVAISFANHSSIDLNAAIDKMVDEDMCFSHRTTCLHGQLRQRLLSWSSHVLSWVDSPDLDVHVMRYEDMKRNPVESFTKAVDFAGLHFSQDAIKKAVAFSDMTEVQRQERERGFKEKPVRSKAFFRRGECGDWKIALTDQHIHRIVAAHGDVMKRFGYLE